MRIIAGSLGGRMFDSPGTHRTHPMSDKMRGAMFNILGELGGLQVLDAFGGSGALAFEAISRGAATALILENDRTAQKTIERNIKTLKLAPAARLVKATAAAWMSTNTEVQFDVVLCDPPYDDLQPNTLNLLAAHVKPDGVLVLSFPASHEPLEFTGLSQVKRQQYGDAQLIFYLAA